jgi:pectate lyase
MSTSSSSTLSTVEPIDESLFQHPYGFASLDVSNREEILTGIYQVGTEVEFLDALLSADVKIIEITADLDLGSISVSQALTLLGRTLVEVRNVYRPHSNSPKLHPILLETGVGQVRFVGRQGLLIYSNHGAMITHAGFLIDQSSDIVIRNLKFSELWEWDEIDEGQYKTNDWDYFTIEESHGIWLDHLEFHQAYDGIMDLKEGVSNVTLSWSKLHFEINAFLLAQIDALETNMSNHPFYEGLRGNGVSKEDIAIWASFQKKGFNFGNTTDGEGFESITVTFHHLSVKNLQDRFPRIRKGDVHLYHVILDNTELDEFGIRENRLPLVNQAIVTTEGGAVWMENSRFIRVRTPIKNHQDANLDSAYTGKYQITNSEWITSQRTFFGSSGEAGTLWIHSGTQPILAFTFRNHLVLPYQYQLNDVYYLTETFHQTPPGIYASETFDWTVIHE